MTPNGSSRSAIIFDGYLPEAKTEERKQRLLRLSKGLGNYFASHPTGVPSGRTGRSQNVVLFPGPFALNSGGSLPIPAFLVPAVIEALNKSGPYGTLTRVVPGEADSFCALHVRSHGGVVLTSDSDLLVHDLGQNGSVAFFSDLELKVDSGEQVVVAAEYLPAHICTRLSIAPGKGIRALAFELSIPLSLTFEQSLERSKRGTSLGAHPMEYDKFIRQYLLPEVVEHEFLSPPAWDLDPRISEHILEVIVLSSRCPPRATSGDQSSEDGIEGASMYLPFLLDSPSRTSAWEASRSVRQAAYGLLQILMDRPIRKVIEFRRLQSPSGGTHLQLPQLSSLDSDCLDIIEPITRIRGITAQPDIQWVMFSVYQDISLSIAQGKTRPLSIQVLQMEARGTLDTTSWEFVHFLAQVQGTLYSLRMLQQIMDFVFNQADQNMSKPFADLRSYLSKIPPLDEFPLLENFAPLLQHIHQAGCLSAFAAAFQFPDDVAAQMMRALHSEERKRQKATKKPRPVPNGRLSNNPFDLLRPG